MIEKLETKMKGFFVDRRCPLGKRNCRSQDFISKATKTHSLTTAVSSNNQSPKEAPKKI